MGQQLYKNNATATLNGTISIGSTTLNLAAGQGSRFPTPTAGDYFLITLYEKSDVGAAINYEVAACTARTADALTITRDFEGMVVAAGGTSGGWAYPAAVGINPSQVVYIEMRATAYLFGNVLNKDANLAGIGVPATARANIGAEGTANKDASGGYPGLTLFKLNLRNAANTITSWFTTAATVARTWTLPDKDGTVAMTSDITGTNSGTNTGDNAVNTTYSGLAAAKQDVSGKDAASGYAGLSATYQINFKNAANTFNSLLENANTAVRTYTFKDQSGTIADLGSNTFTGAQILSDQQLSRGMMIDMGMVFNDKGNSGTSAQTIDYTAGSHQKLTVTGAFVMNAVTNWPPTGNTGELLLELVNGASSAITWTMAGTTQKWWKQDGTSVSSIGSSGYTLQAAGTDWIVMWSTDGGTTTNFKVIR